MQTDCSRFRTIPVDGDGVCLICGKAHSDAVGEPPVTCWLCEGLGAIAVHNKWSEQAGKTLWVAHRPQSRTHPVRPCPACARST